MILFSYTTIYEQRIFNLGAQYLCYDYSVVMLAVIVGEMLTIPKSYIDSI